jgi:hypothetical protein
VSIVNNVGTTLPVIIHILFSLMIPLIFQYDEMIWCKNWCAGTLSSFCPRRICWAPSVRTGSTCSELSRDYQTKHNYLLLYLIHFWLVCRDTQFILSQKDLLGTISLDRKHVLRAKRGLPNQTQLSTSLPNSSLIGVQGHPVHSIPEGSVGHHQSGPEARAQS